MNRIACLVLLLAAPVVAAEPRPLVGDVVWFTWKYDDRPIQGVIARPLPDRRFDGQLGVEWRPVDAEGGPVWTSLDGVTIHPTREAAYKAAAGKIRERAKALNKLADDIEREGGK